jgi:hypothetical protein
MTAYIIFWLVLLVVVIAAFIWGHKLGPCANSLPRVPDEVIGEEIRRERLELHNTSLAYADMQGEKDARAVMMLAAAFRQGAKWQQRRDAR